LSEDNKSGFNGLEQQIISQIVDLHEMEKVGKLNDEYRYFGIDSPRGARWYNFDIGTYLECAARGLFDGWTPEENEDIKLVSGKVAVIDENAKFISVDPNELEDSIYDINAISWDEFKDFLLMGQLYE